MTIDDTTLSALRAKAEATTPGDWNVQDFADPAVSSDPSPRDIYISCSWPDHIGIASMERGLTATLEEARANAAFIAAANPTTILALLDALEEARAIMQFRKDAILRAEPEIATLRDENSTLRAENEWLRAERERAREAVHCRECASAVDALEVDP